VDVHEDRPDPLRSERGDLRLRRAERIVERLHEDPALDVHHPEPPAVRGGDDRAPAPRGAGGVVRRADQPGAGGVEVRPDLALRPDVVAAGEEIDLGGEELFGRVGGDARPGGRVLGVRDHEVEPLARDEARDEPLHGLPAGLAEDVA
jgi:hypothetical protein